MFFYFVQKEQPKKQSDYEERVRKELWRLLEQELNKEQEQSRRAYENMLQESEVDSKNIENMTVEEALEYIGEKTKKKELAEQSRTKQNPITYGVRLAAAIKHV